MHSDRRDFAWTDWRSEEHTSELQSRGLISYAVFCLKKNILSQDCGAPYRGTYFARQLRVPALGSLVALLYAVCLDTRCSERVVLLLLFFFFLKMRPPPNLPPSPPPPLSG